MENKEIWFINKDCAPINENGTFVRTVKQAQFFQDRGYRVRVVCSNWVHNSTIEHKTKNGYAEEVHDNVPFLFVKSIGYRSNGIKRILSYLVFSRRVFRLRKKLAAPDIIVHTSRVPFDSEVYRFANKVKARLIVDVVDLWPLEMEHFRLLKPNGILLRWFYAIENRRYSQAEKVVFSQEGYGQYLRDKGWLLEQGGTIDLRKTCYINNGIELREFNQYLSENKLDDADLADDATFKVIYLGSIRLANHLDTLLDAAKELQGIPDIKVLIYGDGFERDRLEQRVKDEAIKNVVFKQKWTEPQYVPYVLSRAGVNLLNYAANWAPYGGSMNKMMMSFASGKPIVCNAGMRYSPIRDNDLGVDKVFSSSKEYAEAILSIYRLPQEAYEAMCARTRSVARDYDMPMLCEKFKTFCDL